MNVNVRRWDPTTGEHEVFATEREVPEGWLDHYPSDEERGAAAPTPAAAPAVPMTRDEVIAALQSGGIAYKKNAGTKALYDQLVAAMQEHLTTADIAFPPDATAQQLLALLDPAQE